MKALRIACNSKYATRYKSAQIFFILKQGYMFRLKVSHLQPLTKFFVTRHFAHFGDPIVFTTVEYISVKTFENGIDFVYKMCYLQIVSKP